MAYDLSLVPNTGIDEPALRRRTHPQLWEPSPRQTAHFVFDINDFDETISGPFEWDVKRMAASLILAGREAGAKNIQCQEATAVFLDRYRRTILDLSRRPVLDLAHYQVKRLNDVSTIAGILHTAERATPMHNLLALTEKPAQPTGKPAINSVSKDASQIQILRYH